jgi:hypothetical protein
MRFRPKHVQYVMWWINEDKTIFGVVLIVGSVINIQWDLSTALKVQFIWASSVWPIVYDKLLGYEPRLGHVVPSLWRVLWGSELGSSLRGSRVRSGAVTADRTVFNISCLLWTMGLHLSYVFQVCSLLKCRSQWPRGLRRESAGAHLLGLWVRIPPGA